MANVLPLQDRKTLRRNYWLRFTITFAFLVTAVMTVGTVSLFPAYFLARGEATEATRYLSLQEEARDITKRDSAVTIARFVDTQIMELTKNETVRASDAIHIVLRDWSVHAEEIVITNFYFENKDKSELRLSGVAQDRAALNSFVQTLRADTRFSQVSFPVSDLAREGIVDFSLTLVVQKK